MKKNPENSPNYKSFFTRDYKSASISAAPTPRRFTKLHLVLVIASVSVIGTLLSFFSMDADAFRTSTDVASAPEPATVINAAPTANTTLPINAIASTPATNTSPREWMNESIRSGDSIAKVFARLQLPSTELYKIMQNAEAKKYLKQVQPGQTLKLLVDDKQVVHTLVFELNRFDSFAMQRDGDNYIASSHHRDVEKRVNHSVTQIESSLFETGQRAGLSNSLILELANIFAWDIDFALDIRNGDQFAMIYEEHYLDGEKIAQGPILAAEFINQGRVYRAVRYTDQDGTSSYYTPDGISLRKAFLRSPVDFRRISSRFGNRHHPILNKMKMHKGVDYSAPVGTPIHASGDGKVAFKGTKGGYGRVVILQHGGMYSTLYGHMSGFKRGVDVGSHVRQGQVIGYVGRSGLATGPHLHYEFRVNGVHRNPLTIKLPNADPIPAQFKSAFLQQTQPLLASLETVKQQTNVALHHP